MKVLVIGAGQFGRNLALELTERGIEVTLVDSREDRIQEVASRVARAIVGDGAERRVLENLDLESFGVVVNAIGEESLEASILCSALLRELKSRRVMARVAGELHARILRALGVDEIIHPESFVAKSLARKIAAPEVTEQLSLDRDTQLVEMAVPEAWVGRSLKELELRQHFGVNVVAIRRPGPGGSHRLDPSPAPDAPLAREEVLVILGVTASMEAFLKENP